MFTEEPKGLTCNVSGRFHWMTVTAGALLGGLALVGLALAPAAYGQPGGGGGGGSISLPGGVVIPTQPTVQGSGTTDKGSNVDRNADTRPKDCIATDSAGRETAVPCPANVPKRK